MKHWCNSITLENIRNVGDAAQKWATVIALIIGGYWTYRIYHTAGTENSNWSVVVSADVAPYTQSTKLIAAHVSVKNSGKTPVTIDHGTCNIWLKRLPDNASVGPLPTGGLKRLYQTNLDKKYGEIVVEPGLDSKEETIFVVSPGRYLIEVETYVDGDMENATTLAIVS